MPKQTKVQRMQRSLHLIRMAAIPLNSAITLELIGSKEAAAKMYNQHLDLMADWMMNATKEGVETETQIELTETENQQWQKIKKEKTT